MAITINGDSGISGVDGSAATPALQGTDTNTGISFGTDEVNINTGGTTRAKVDSSGRMLVGTSSARTAWNNTTIGANILQVERAGDAASTAISICANPGTSATETARLLLGRTRGNTVGATTVVASGDVLGLVSFQGSDGTEMVEAAEIAAVVDGTPGSNDMPCRLVFSTTPDSGSSPVERLRIDNKGRADLTCVNGGNAALYVAHNSGDQYGINVTTASDQNSIFRYFLACYGGATQRATIRSDGGLANYSANNVNLSDINAKKDISSAASTWDCLKDWEIVNFRYKDQPDDADLNMGVIAQQVAVNCPEVITIFQEAKEATDTEPAQEERLGVKDQQMMWMAIKALQEAQIRIETLETRLAAIEGGTN